MKTRTIRQTATFKADPHEIFEMLMDSKKHSAFTRSKASISRKAGGKISAYDGYISGENMEIVNDKKIVQKWRGSDWPENHFSIATFDIKRIPGGTKLAFTQTDVPEDQYESIKEGWGEYYCDKMKKFA
jgi:activator of HSP90 ATPase